MVFCNGMREFEQKRKIQNIKHSWWFSLILICVIIVLLISVLRMVGSYRYAKHHQKARQKEYQELLTKQQDLTESVNQLNTKEGLEEVLREKYRAVKQGEELVVVLDESK